MVRHSVDLENHTVYCIFELLPNTFPLVAVPEDMGSVVPCSFAIGMLTDVGVLLFEYMQQSVWWTYAPRYYIL